MNRYEIRVTGHVDPRRAHALGAEECRWLEGGESLLVLGPIDQAALHAVLTRLRDAGIELVALAPCAGSSLAESAESTNERMAQRRQSR